MAKIRHLAIRTKDPKALADFYVKTFGLDVIMESDSGAVSLSDGDFNLSFLPRREGQKEGLDHFGFEIEDMAEISARAAEAGVNGPGIGTEDPPYAETRLKDPDGNQVDLSVHGFASIERKADRAKTG